MQVQAINTKKNTLTPTLSQRARVKNLSFGAIYKPKKVNFNKVQKPVVEAIKKALREPLQKFKGKTAEYFYESKGVDFEITPYKSKSVSLTAYKGMKEIGTGVDRRCTYLERVYIGEYDQNSEFRVSDIESAIKDKKGSDFGFGFIITALIGLVTVLTLGNYMSRHSNNKIQETTKPLIEKVDSVANKAKAVQPILEDSFKLGKKFIKK